MTEFRVLADENTSPDVAARLREHGRTATHVTDALDFGATDQEIVTYAEAHVTLVDDSELWLSDFYQDGQCKMGRANAAYRTTNGSRPFQMI